MKAYEVPNVHDARVHKVEQCVAMRELKPEMYRTKIDKPNNYKEHHDYDFDVVGEVA